MRLTQGWRSLLFGALVSGMSVTACQCYPEPFQVYEPPAEVAPVARKVSGLFIDAKTNQLLEVPLSVSVRNATGVLSKLVKDDATKAVKNQFTVENGVLTFEVDDKATLPQTFTIVAFGEGYLSSSAKVTITEDGAYDFLTRLVKISETPAGVAAKQQTLGTADSSGTLMTATTIETQAESTTGGTVELAIPAMTQVKAADGTPLTGTLTATVSYFNNTDPTSLSAFPGGFEVTIPEGNSQSSGVFISGGFAAIEIRDASGKLASTFSQPVAVSVGVPSATVNPNTGVAVQAGQAVPFWSYNETTGQWKGEGNVTLGAVNGGIMTVTGMVDHLSYFNVDWFEQPCGTARRIDITGNPSQLGFALELKNAGRGFIRNLQVPGGAASTFVQLSYVPSDMPMILTAFHQGQKVGETTVSDLCLGGPISFALNMPNVQPATLSVKVEKVCSDDTNVRTAVPSQTVVVSPQGANVTPLAPRTTDATGTATFEGLSSGATVSIRAQTTAGYVTQTNVLAAGANEVRFEDVVACKNITGAQGSAP